jgi:glycosyltransferase involved in cell wall biosynthesis
MRLLLVASSENRRGTETHLSTLATALVAAGHEVAALVRPRSFLGRALHSSGVLVIAGWFRNALDPRGWLALSAACSRWKPHWVVGSFAHEYWPTLLLGRRAGARVVLFRHMPAPLGQLTRRWVPRLADRFIAVSSFIRSGLIDTGVPAERVDLLHNPVDTARFKPNPAERVRLRRELEVSADSFVLGYVGTLAETKGTGFLARAVDEVAAVAPRLHALWVTNAPPTQQFLESLRPGALLRHRFLGPCDNVAPYYNAMDALAVPSQWPEPFGRAAIEGQASGLPVLANRIGGLTEAFPEGAPLLTAGDAAAWRAAILNLVHLSPEERLRSGQRGRGFVVERFDMHTIAARFIELLSAPESGKR